MPRSPILTDAEIANTVPSMVRDILATLERRGYPVAVTNGLDGIQVFSTRWRGGIDCLTLVKRFNRPGSFPALPWSTEQ